MQCQYLSPSVSGSRPTSASLNGIAHVQASNSGASDVSSTATISNPSPLPLVGVHPRPLVDLDSIELLHHWQTITCTSLSPELDQQDVWRTFAVKQGLSHPFVLYQLLAIAALHLATCRPERQDEYTTRSTELQNGALSMFHQVEGTDETNCIAMFLFSSLLGVHLFADRAPIRGIGFSEYLDHSLRCVTLLRSVMKLSLKEFYPFFMDTEIKSLMRAPDAQPPYEGIPAECRHLEDLIKESDLGPSSVTAYNAALDRLFWLFALTEVPTVARGTARWPIGWPVQLPDEYIMLLNQRRPEALIILAYFGVVLHLYRESWMIGDTGASLIRAVNAQVGTFWDPWMAWPLQMIDST
ncbi:MAG: hypothetical protein L6R39_002281 [Caloplaca ligustica]|nr:MAG: hypothetical protein L6R39_002281 [Caloplaca ligustica]